MCYHRSFDKVLWVLYGEYSFPLKMELKKKGFTEKVPLMPTLEKWVGLTSGTRRKSISGRGISIGRIMER